MAEPNSAQALQQSPQMTPTAAAPGPESSQDARPATSTPHSHSDIDHAPSASSAAVEGSAGLLDMGEAGGMPPRPQASLQAGALGEAPALPVPGFMPHVAGPPPSTAIGPKVFPSAVVPGSVKLFVGQIPRTMNEPALRPVFEEMGEILELAIIRDRNSHLHKGCAFLTYRTAEAAHAAIKKFHDKITFPPMTHPLQVKLANVEDDASRSDVKLFVGHLGLQDDEFLLRPIFERFGEVEEIVVLRDSRSNISKRSGFVRYTEPISAQAAIAGLNGRQLFVGGEPVVVKFARNRASKQQQGEHVAYGGGGVGGGGLAPQYGHPTDAGAGGGAYPHDGDDKPAPTAAGYGMHKANGRPVEGPAGANLFIYHLPQGLTDEDLANAFANFGPVVSAKVYVDKRTGESRGFGFVSYSDPVHASSAIQGMNGFSLGNKKLKVEHKKPGRQRAPRVPHAHAAPQVPMGGGMPLHAYPPHTHTGGGHPGASPAYGMAPFPGAYSVYGASPQAAMYAPMPHGMPPPSAGTFYSPSHYYQAAAAYGYPSVRAGLAAAGLSASAPHSAATPAGSPVAYSAPQSALGAVGSPAEGGAPQGEGGAGASGAPPAESQPE